MAGIRKLSGPNTARLAAVQTMPMIPAARFSFFFTCSSSSTINSAVSVKSKPVVSKVSSPPTAFPIVQPTCQ